MRAHKFRFYNALGNNEMLVYTLTELLNMKNAQQLLGNSPAMQYTGLRDKNGKEIYEGDIVISVGYTHMGKSIIKYSDYLGSYIMESATGYTDDTLGGMMEVIGNIYENPELLEDKQ